MPTPIRGGTRSGHGSKTSEFFNSGRKNLGPSYSFSPRMATSNTSMRSSHRTSSDASPLNTRLGKSISAGNSANNAHSTAYTNVYSSGYKQGQSTQSKRRAARVQSDAARRQNKIGHPDLVRPGEAVMTIGQGGRTLIAGGL